MARVRAKGPNCRLEPVRSHATRHLHKTNTYADSDCVFLFLIPHLRWRAFGHVCLLLRLLRERVYGEPVTGLVDLNTFRWFYNWAPLHLLKHRPVGVDDARTLHWTSKLYYCLGDFVCSYYKQYGYFVGRPSYNYGKLPSGRIEMLHHSCDAEDDSTDVWFYYLPGSGVFLESTANVSVAYWDIKGAPDELVWKSVDSVYYHRENGRRVMNCQAFSSGLSRRTECVCGASDPITRCMHPLIPLERRQLLGAEGC